MKQLMQKVSYAAILIGRIMGLSVRLSVIKKNWYANFPQFRRNRSANCQDKMSNVRVGVKAPGAHL